jgi:serine/threonine protein kinase
VYVAKKEERPIRLKIVVTEDTSFRQRCTFAWSKFSRIDHANVLSAHDMVTDKQLVFASDYVPTVSLADYLLRGHHCSRNEIVHIVESVARALEIGASEGLPHLNLKPTNVLLAGQRGELPKVYVTDFGMGRQSWDHVSLEIGDVRPADLPYIPPECLTDTPHERSDVYSLGVIAHALLTGSNGTVPNPGLMLWAYSNGVTLPLADVEDLPGKVAAALSSATTHMPGKRPASSTEFSRLLAYALEVAQSTDTTSVAALPAGVRDTPQVSDDEKAFMRAFEIVAIVIVMALLACVCTLLIAKVVGLA